MESIIKVIYNFHVSTTNSWISKVSGLIGEILDNDIGTDSLFIDSLLKENLQTQLSIDIS